MMLGARKLMLGTIGATAACLLGVALAGGQSAPAEKPVLSEDAFKNVQVLKGIPVGQFMESMGFISASLGKSCEYCHDVGSGNWSDYATETPLKKKARQMMLMMDAINKANFGGRRVVTCYTCHNGGEQPKATPSIAGVYAEPTPEDPNEVPLGQAPKGATADQIFSKYIQALGGEQNLASLTSYTAKGISVGYGDESYDRAVEIFAKAPNEHSTVIHTASGDNSNVYDGHQGWAAAPQTAAPVPVLPLTGSDLDSAKIDAAVSFPAQLKGLATTWRVGSPVMLDGHDTEIVQGNVGGRPVRLFFDKDSGLLTRMVRYTDSSLGLNQIQEDYSDYRAVSGVRMPFKWTLTWLDGVSTFTLSDVKANVAIPADKFEKPNPPVAPPKKAAQ